MATIKLQPSGNVLIKDGKVSCGCCAEPEGCCPYPAQALVDGLYTVDDLPDEIFVISSYGNIILPIDRSGPIGDRGIKYYSGIIDGEEVSVSLDTESDPVAKWSGSAEVDTIGDCLITKLEIADPGGPTLDQFADTYSWFSASPFAGDTGPYVSSTVSRVSLCRWEGPLLPFVEGTIFCRPVLIIYRGLNDVPNEYAFVWRMQWEGPLAETSSDKIGFNNTPVGHYNEGSFETDWEIS